MLFFFLCIPETLVGIDQRLRWIEMVNRSPNRTHSTRTIWRKRSGHFTFIPIEVTNMFITYISIGRFLDLVLYPSFPVLRNIFILYQHT